MQELVFGLMKNGGWPCHWGPFHSKLLFKLLVIIFFWAIWIFIRHYYRYYFIKKEVRNFRKTLDFVESQNGENPYEKGKFASVPGYRLARIFFGGLWEIHHKKIEKRDLKLNSIKSQIENRLLVRNYSLYTCILAVFLGLLGAFLWIRDMFFSLAVMTSQELRDFTFAILFSEIASCLLSILILALIDSFLALWVFTSSRRMYRWLLVEISELDWLLYEKCWKKEFSAASDSIK